MLNVGQDNQEKSKKEKEIEIERETEWRRITISVEIVRGRENHWNYLMVIMEKLEKPVKRQKKNQSKLTVSNCSTYGQSRWSTPLLLLLGTE